MRQRDRHRWYQIKNSAPDDDGRAEILLYGEIDSYFGVDAADFIRDLATVDAPEVLVRINSPGGDIFDGVAILNALRGHDARIIVQVDSLAASAASVIAMAGDEIIMNANAQLMLHNAWALVVGSSVDMQRAADMLERQNDNIADIYASRAGGTVADWRAVMDDETWMNAEEAVDAGLADSITTLDPKAATAAARAAASFDRSRFRYDGRQSAPAPNIAARLRDPDRNEDTVPANTTQFSRRDDERTVDAAIRDGKIMAADRAKWVERLQQDPHGFRSLLSAMAAVPGLNPSAPALSQAAAEQAELAASFAKVTGHSAPERPATPNGATYARTPAPRKGPNPRATATSSDTERVTPVVFNPSGDPIYERVETGRPRSEWTEEEIRDAAIWNLGPRFRDGLEPPPETRSYIRDLTEPHLVENTDGTWHWERTDPYA